MIRVSFKRFSVVFAVGVDANMIYRAITPFFWIGTIAMENPPLTEDKFPNLKHWSRFAFGVTWWNFDLIIMIGWFK